MHQIPQSERTDNAADLSVDDIDKQISHLMKQKNNLIKRQGNQNQIRVQKLAEPDVPKPSTTVQDGLAFQFKRSKALKVKEAQARERYGLVWSGS